MKTLLIPLAFLAVVGRCMSQSLECASCNEAPTIEECRLTTTVCAPNEQCFLEKITTAQLTVGYNAGCRSETVCRIMSGLGAGKRSTEEEEDEGREKRQHSLINCAECCNSPRDKTYGSCNLQLCGQRPNATSASCLVCPGNHPGPNFCRSKDTCQDTQVCYTGILWVNGGVRYTYGCEEKHLCEALIKNKNVSSSIGGRRETPGLQLCDACCKGDECNREDCFDLAKKMTLASIGVISGQTSPPLTQRPFPTTQIPTTQRPTAQPTTQRPTAQPTTQRPTTPSTTQRPSTQPPSTKVTTTQRPVTLSQNPSTARPSQASTLSILTRPSNQPATPAAVSSNVPPTVAGGR